MSTTAVEADTTPQLSRRQLLLLFSGLMTAMLLAALDQMILGTAMPTIVLELGGIEQYAWVITAYLLASTASTPLYGKLSDLYGRRPVLLFAIITFLVGSVLAGASPNMSWLIATRAIQGLGAGGLMTLAFTVISAVVSPRERGRYLGLFGAVFGLSSIAGPILGGYFAEHNWRWIFYINLPLGVVALLLCNQVLRVVPHVRRDHVIDWAGAAALVSGASCLLLALSWGGTQYAWGSPMILGLFAAALALGAAFIYIESRAAEPILPLKLFHSSTFSLGNSAGFILGFCMFGSIIYLPLYLQIVQGVSPRDSGLMLLPMMAGIIGSSIISGRMISAIGRYKWFPVVGSSLTAVGLALFTLLEVDTPLWQAELTMTVIGIGLGLTMQPIILAVQNSLELRDIGAGTSAAAFFRSLGGSLGVAVLGAIMNNRLNAQLAQAGQALPEQVRAQFPQLRADMLNQPSALQALPQQVQDAFGQAFVNALHPVFLVATGVALVAVVLTVALPDRELRGPAAGPPSTEDTSGDSERDLAAAHAQNVG